MESLLNHETILTNGIRLHVVTAGKSDGAPLIFLHGFPEFWFGWRKQIDHFAKLGYRVIVPDQRGYGQSERPPAIGDYRIDQLGRDIVGIIDWSGHAQAVVIGHDWGAAVTWWLAMSHPERLRKVVILNVPHPRVMFQNLKGNWRQLFKSWYIFFFQIPMLPEWLLSRFHFLSLKRSLQKTSRPGTFSNADIEPYVEAWSKPGALRSMIHWYRAALRAGTPTIDPTITRPLLIIWGARDPFLHRDMATQSLLYCPQGELKMIEMATHWVQHEEAEQVNQLIEQFIAQ